MELPEILNITPEKLLELDMSISEIHVAIEKMLPGDWVNPRENRPFSGFLFVLDGVISYHHITASSTPANQINLTNRINQINQYEDISESNKNPARLNHDIIAEKYNIIYLARGSSYVLSAKGGSQINYFLVNFDFADYGAMMDRIAFPRIFKPSGHSKYLDLFSQLEDTYFYCTAGYRMQMRILLATILHNLVQDYLKTIAPLGNIGRIMPAIKFMEENFDTEIDMNKLPEMAGMSPTHFRRLFTQLYKIPPKEYLIRLKINKAKMLLQNRSNSIGNIAEKTGFSDTAYFCKIFRREIGVTPGKYRGNERKL